jgi:hypothetical protein
MNINDYIGFIGVFILLLAFFLNLIKKIAQDNLVYILLNIIGAAMAGIASYMIHYIPFIILEGAWTLVSIGGLIKYLNKK